MKRLPRSIHPSVLTALALAYGVIFSLGIIAGRGPQTAYIPPVMPFPTATRDPIPTTGLAGQVVDILTGQPIAQAKVEAGGLSAKTDAQGTFWLPLPPGVYDVRAVAPAYIGMRLLQRPVRHAPQQQKLLFEMIPAHPTETQAIAIDRKLLPRRARPAATLPRFRPGIDFREDLTTAPRTVRVLEPDGMIVTMEMDEYLRGVLPLEIGPHRPMEALKAQASVARAFAAMHCIPESAGDPTKCEPELDANVDTTLATQLYDPLRRYDTTDEAVYVTHGIVPRYAGRVIEALFFAYSDGQTRASQTVFHVDRPYLQSIADPAAFDQVAGHGVGFSQQGAVVLAEWGATFDEILRYFYPGIEIAPPQVPVLGAPTVSSLTPDSQTPVRFEITYADPEGDPPVVADLYLNGYAYPMTWMDGDLQTGARYAYTTTLEAGQYTYEFHFHDGFTDPITADGGTLTVRVARDPGRPAAPANDQQTRSGQWRQSSQRDWLSGTLEALSVIGGTDAALTVEGNAGVARYTSTILEADFPFIAVGAHWQGEIPDGREMRIDVQASSDRQSWSPWVALPPGDGGRWVPLDHWSELAFVSGRYLRYRVTFWATDTNAPQPYLDGITLTYIYAPPGPAETFASQPTSHTEPQIIPRSEWCTTCDDPPSWQPEYRTPTKFIIHHTVSSNDHDGYQAVRAIHNYHAKVRGWGDIGYNFLIDREGRIFEGRYGGENENGETVVGGHALQFNYGSIGVALIGTYSEVEPLAPTQEALIDLLVSKGLRYGIDPFDNGELAGTEFPYGILGHRDVLPGHTVCPGQAAWELLPQIRDEVEAGLREHTNEPSPTPTLTRSPTPTLPPGCYDYVKNGGFETLDEGWIRNKAYYTAQARTGNRAMFIGLLDSDPDDNVFASAQQTIVIPSNVNSIDLSFWYQTVAHGDTGDQFIIRIFDDQDHAIFTRSLPADTKGWVQAQESLTDLLPNRPAGTPIRLYFGVVNDGDRDNKKAYMRIDDVSLIICQGGVTATTTPSTTPTATVTTTPTSLATGTPSVTLSPTFTSTPSPSLTPTPTATATPVPPTATPTPTATVTPLPTPTDWECFNPVVDPGFEAGGTAWTIPTTAYKGRITDQRAHSGRFAALVGITNPDADRFSFSSIWQEIQVPATAERVTLSYWHYPLSLDPEDRQIVEIREPEEATRNRLAGFAGQTSNEQTWLFRSFDLTEHYPGKKIQLYFSAFNRNQEGAPGGVTAMYVDDVTLEICQTRVERPFVVRLPLLSRRD